MADYIDRDEALNCFTSWIDQYGYPHEPNEIREYEAIAALEDPIIRCADCRHYQFAHHRAFGFPVMRCEYTGFEDVEDSDFCSRAERREE